MASYSLLRAKGFYHRPLTFFWSRLHFQGWRKTWESQNFCSIFTALTFLSVLTCESPSLDFFLVCVASVSVGLGSKRLTPLSFFGSRPIFRTGKHRKPRSSVLLCSQTPRKRLLRRLDFFFSQSCLAVCIFLQSYKNWGLGLASTRRNTLVSPFLGSLVIHQPFLPLCWIWFSGPCQ